ncbi:MAG: polyphosphate polymerase domain-containing protein [Bacteroidales bacterium]|nr:polyphosphate polymerase domain-containing protein [Bacteroidales bacterium]
MLKALDEILSRFSPILLEEMEAVKLMNRIDTKHIARTDQLIPLLERMTESYYIQQINGKRIAQYHTLYMDTPDADMYLAHHNDRKVRQKIRIRDYEESNLSFFEIKNKNNKGRTKKKRVKLENTDYYKNGQVLELMDKYAKFKIEGLIPQLENFFNRITLVNKDKTERLTIDLNLKFHHLQTQAWSDLSKLIVIELKQDGNCRSHAKEILSSLRIHPNTISKYCIGSVLTNPELKNNRFKSKLTLINKIINN